MNNRIFTPKAAPSISINGHIFELKLGDAAVMQRVDDAKKFCAEILSKKADQFAADDMIAVGRQVESAINDICGENAMRTMVGGAVMRVRDCIDLLCIVSEEAGKAYIEELMAKNE